MQFYVCTDLVAALMAPGARACLTPPAGEV